jgi:predicted AAA+ superfamily ATPase
MGLCYATAMISRLYDDLVKYLKPNRAVIIFGPRRVGKTTLLNNFLSKTKLRYRLDNGENLQVQEILSSQDFSQIIPYVNRYQLYAIDEAHKVPGIGMALKIIVDQIPGINIIATGSSSFALSGQTGEPLTGRKISLMLYPVSQAELSKDFSPVELRQKLPEFLVFGGYPEVLTAADKLEKMRILQELVNSYLLKDILEMERVKGAKVLLDLLRLVAFQVGGEVSLSELSRELGMDLKTIARYLDLFEKSFILYNLRGFSRNLRSEINRKSKYFFYDNGVRNAVISNFNEVELRDDVGKLWENFLVAERLKKQAYAPVFANNYFWRTWEQKEIDWVEEREGKLFGFEFKYLPGQKIRGAKEFQQAYQNSALETISRDNYFDFVI